ncbi:MAG: 50S ribosomal protein L23 [Firmicutes bacterium]|nr:50S ribosomal protein L23 [Bacillota bacterium]
MPATLRDVLLRPVVTEKSTDQMGKNNKYTFYVAPDANRTEVKQAVEKLFKVTVLKVNVIRGEGKRKRLGRYEGKRPDWKKAVVTLKPGDRIGIFEGV